MTMVPWTRATSGIAEVEARQTSSALPPPLCGPAPVTTVPVTTTTTTPSTSRTATHRDDPVADGPRTLGRSIASWQSGPQVVQDHPRIGEQDDGHEEVRHHEPEA